MQKADMQVLVVEDREVMLKIIGRLMQELGFPNVDHAINGIAALECMRNKSYDLILSDWNMDGMTGFQLLKRVRSLPRTAKIPFILITAEAKPENILAAKKAGANGYLLKPFKLDALETMLNAVLSNAEFLAPEVA